MRETVPTATCHLAFDDRVKFGSRQHFYHFLLGYLLPAVHLVRRRGGVEHYRFDSCGPVMDPLIGEAMALAGVERWAIAEGSAHDEPSANVLVPRWDVRLLRDILVGPERDAHRFIRHMRRDLRSHPELLSDLESNDAIPRLRTDLGELRTFFLEAVGAGLPAGVKGGDHLLLVRSKQPDFYARGGPAEIAGYGTYRRSLLGVTEGARWLASHGYPVAVFEPGAHSISDQVRAFGACAGIIAIAGAELANIVWMAPGSRVVVLRPRVMDHPFVSEVLARLLGIEYVALDVEGKTPHLDPTSVAPYLLRRSA